MRAVSYQHVGTYDKEPAHSISLDHDQRHLRRKMLELADGEKLLVDLPKTVALEEGDVLVLEDDELVRIVAAPELLYQITARDSGHLARICWHIGNRHLPAQISEDAILIQRDHVIRDMLKGLGADVVEITAPFAPERGAYHSHGHAHAHGGSDHEHD